MFAPKPSRDSRVMRPGLGRKIFRMALLMAVIGGTQACARNHPNAFANARALQAPALQPQCSIDVQHSGPRTRIFEGSAARFKRRAKLTYIWSFSDEPAEKVPGREFTVTFTSSVPRRAATIHLVVSASDGTRADCDTVIW